MKFSKLIRKTVVFLSAAMLSLVPVTAHAEPSAAGVSGPSVTFDKYLILNRDANVPNASFSFSITPGTPINASDGKPQVFAGISADQVTLSNATFTAGEEASTTVDANDAVDLPEDKQYLSKPVTADFSRVRYTVPGIYRYVITENTPTEDGISIQEGSTARILDVYVESDDTGVLKITGTVLHADSTLIASGTYSSKPTGFTNLLTTHKVLLQKTVTGNMADRSKVFDFTVTLTGPSGSSYKVTVNTTNPSGLSNPAQITIPAEGAATVTAKLQMRGGDSIEISGLTASVTCKVIESDYSAEGYTTTNTLDNAAPKAGSTCEISSIGAADHAVTFINHRSGELPTGVLLNVWPYLFLLLAAAALTVTRFLGRRKQ